MWLTTAAAGATVEPSRINPASIRTIVTNARRFGRIVAGNRSVLRQHSQLITMACLRLHRMGLLASAAAWTSKTFAMDLY